MSAVGMHEDEKHGGVLQLREVWLYAALPLAKQHPVKINPELIGFIAVK